MSRRYIAKAASFCWMAAVLASCGGIVVVDDARDVGHSGGGGPGGQDGGAQDGGDAAADGSDAHAPVYCNKLKGPLDEYDGDPQTHLCKSWEVCALIQESGYWACRHPDEVP